MANKPRSKARAVNNIKNVKAGLVGAQSDVQRVQKQAEDTNNQHLKELVTMFRKNRRMCRGIEEAIAAEPTNTRLVYGLMTIYSQQREIIADIRAVSDLSGQVAQISNNILQPAAQSQAHILTNMFYQMRKLMTETVEKKHTEFALRQLETIVGDLARDSQATFETISSKINETLMSR